MIDLDLEDPFDLDDEIVEAAAAPKSTRPRAAPRRRKRAPIARPPAGARCPHSTQPTADPRVCTQCLAVVVDRIVAGEPIAGAAPVAEPLAAPIVASDLIDREPRATSGLERCPTAPVGQWTLGEVSALTGKSRASLRRSLARAGVEPVGKLRRQGPATLVFDRRAVEAWLKTRPARGAGVQP